MCLITESAETGREVASLISWCDSNNLSAEKVKEAIAGVKKKMRPHTPLTIRELEVERESS